MNPKHQNYVRIFFMTTMLVIVALAFLKICYSVYHPNHQDSPKFEGTSGIIINTPVLPEEGLMPQPNVTDYTFLHFSDSTEFFETCELAIADAKSQGVKSVREIVFQTDNGYKEISCKDFLKFLDTVPEVKTGTNDSSK